MDVGYMAMPQCPLLALYRPFPLSALFRMYPDAKSLSRTALPAMAYRLRSRGRAPLR